MSVFNSVFVCACVWARSSVWGCECVHVRCQAASPADQRPEDSAGFTSYLKLQLVSVLHVLGLLASCACKLGLYRHVYKRANTHTHTYTHIDIRLSAGKFSPSCAQKRLLNSSTRTHAHVCVHARTHRYVVITGTCLSLTTPSMLVR